MENDGFLDALAEAFRKAQSVSPPKEASGSYIRFKTDYEDACKQQNAQFSDQLASQQWENLENESKQEYARLAKRDQEYYSKLLSKYNHINNLRKKKPDGSVLFFSEKGLTKSHYNLQQQWDQISLEEKRIYELKAKQNQQDIIKSLIEEYILEYKNYENCLKEKPQNIKFINKQEDDNDEIDQIDIIIGIKRINGKKEYLVRFKGKTGKDAKWFPKKRLRKVKDLVKEFEDAYFRQSFQDEDPSSGFDSTPQQKNVQNQEKHEKIDDVEIDQQPQPEVNQSPNNNSEEKLNQKGVEKINQKRIKQKSPNQLKSQSKSKQQTGATKKIKKTRIPRLPEEKTVSKKKNIERRRLAQPKQKQKNEKQKEHKIKQLKKKEKNIQASTDEPKNQKVKVKQSQANQSKQVKSIPKIAKKSTKGKIQRKSKSLESQKTQETEHQTIILRQKQDSSKNEKKNIKFKENKLSKNTIKQKNLQKNQKKIDKNTNFQQRSDLSKNKILSKTIQKEVSKKKKVKTESKDQSDKKKKVKQISISSKNEQQIKQISSQKPSKQDDLKNIKQKKTLSNKTVPKIIKKEIRKQISTRQTITHSKPQQEKIKIQKNKQNNFNPSAVLRKKKQRKSGSTRKN